MRYKNDVLASREYSAASNFKKQGKVRCKSSFPKLNQAKAIHTSKLHLET